MLYKYFLPICSFSLYPLKKVSLREIFFSLILMESNLMAHAFAVKPKKYFSSPRLWRYSPVYFSFPESFMVSHFILKKMVQSELIFAQALTFMLRLICWRGYTPFTELLLYFYPNWAVVKLVVMMAELMNILKTTELSTLKGQFYFIGIIFQ